MTKKYAMQRRAQEYLDERRRLGYALSTTGNRLQAFARFADKVGYKGPLTLKLIVDWAKGQATRATPIPPADMFGRAYRRLTPHIYSDEEIADLLAAAGRLPPAGALRPATYRALFGLIAATGLRHSEALRLLCSDFDAAQKRLTLGMCICIQQ
jgi:integrase